VTERSEEDGTHVSRQNQQQAVTHDRFLPVLEALAEEDRLRPGRFAYQMRKNCEKADVGQEDDEAESSLPIRCVVDVLTLSEPHQPMLEPERTARRGWRARTT